MIDSTKALGITAVAVSIMSVVVLSYVHSFIYTRIEGEKLENRVERGFDKVNGKLDTMFNLIHEKSLLK